MARPIFIALLAVWLWRLILLFLLLKRIAALDLAIVPTHPVLEAWASSKN